MNEYQFSESVDLSLDSTYTQSVGRTTTTTLFNITEPGTYYFACSLSETTFHCKSGQKVTVVVGELDSDMEPPAPAPDTED